MYEDMDVFERLAVAAKHQKKSNIGIINYIRNFEDDYSELKIADISKTVHVSESTVSRFIKSLEYESFSEFKWNLRLDAKKYDGDDHIDVKVHSIESHFQDIVKTFEMTTIDLNERDLDEIVALIKDADKINIFALGETNIVAQDLQLKLVRIGYNANAYSDIHTQHFTACNSSEKTVSIAITYSSSTKEVLRNLQTAKKYNSKTVLIGNKHTNNNDYIDYKLNAQATESVSRVFSTTSRLAMLFVIDLLYHRIINSDVEEYTKKLNLTRLIKK